MTDVTRPDSELASFDHPEPKGLKKDAIALVMSTAVGLASTAPAYSMAATLGFVVVIIGVQTPLLVVLAFIPMFFSSWANKEMNTADPDCGTTFTGAARALGPRTGWFAGGWGQVAARIQVALIVVETIVLALLAVVAFWKVGAGTAPAGHLVPSWSWFDPFKISSFNTFMKGMLLMAFIYWGWDTTVSLNEETEDPRGTPGTAGVLSTVTCSPPTSW